MADIASWLPYTLSLGDGIKSCVPIDKCKDPSLNSCDKKTTKCKQVPNTSRYRCECFTGFIPPANSSSTVYYTCAGWFAPSAHSRDPCRHEIRVPKSVVDEDECASGHANCDPLTEECVNNIGSYKCLCKNGFRRDQKLGKCVDIDECAEDEAFVETVKMCECWASTCSHDSFL